MVEGAVDRLLAESRAEACAAGRKLALVHEIACAAPVAEFAAVEVACALTLSRFAAENLVTLASALCDRLPAVLCALSNGDIDLYKARVFSEVLADLEVAAAQSIAALVLPKAATRTAGQLRDMLRRKALAADPAYAAARRERASAHRAVQLHACDDGTASLTAFGLDAARATAAMQRIAAIARQRQFTGDPASTSASTDSASTTTTSTGAGAGAGTGRVPTGSTSGTGRSPSTRPGTSTSTGTSAGTGSSTGPAPSTQDGTSAGSGHGRGLGRIKANGEKASTQTGSAVAHADGTWPNTDPSANVGAPAGAGTAAASAQRVRGAGAEDAGDSLARPPEQDPRDRVANAAMTRWIRLRDKTCRTPGCRMPAWQTDIDHNQRYSDGGLTTHDNLCALCRL